MKKAPQNDIESLSSTIDRQSRHYYTWRDVVIMVFFVGIVLLGLTNLDSPMRLVAYNYSSIVIGAIGLLSVIFRWKRVEGVMLVTWGLLIMARGVLLLPYGVYADNDSLQDWVLDILNNRALADGFMNALAIFVLSAYRQRRGRVQR